MFRYEIIPTFSFNKNKEQFADNIHKICIHHFVTKLSNQSQPPGLADFIRGTIALYKLCKEYNFKLRINSEHPIFNWLESSDLLTTKTYSPLYEYVSVIIPYGEVYTKLLQLFTQKDIFSVTTNSFYSSDTNLYNSYHMGEIQSDAKLFIKKIMKPSYTLQTYVTSVFDTLKIVSQSYHVIHLRFGDKYIHTDQLDNTKINKVITHIEEIIQEKQNEPCVLISDSNTIATTICTTLPLLRYWNNKKIHLGDMTSYNMDDINDNIRDTLVDFIIISLSNSIISLNNSGFSKIISLVYDIPYSNFSFTIEY
jgi:hypothetical protein